VALTVRPDDEVYQFDTVWLGPDEYTLPIQARYVAWGTWLACFLITAAVLVPIGGSGPGGVVGSLIWSIALSVVASRAVMLVVDHDRPLRSLPALFSAEAQAAFAASRRGERPVLVRPSRVRVRELPERARRIRDKKRRAEQRRAEHHGRRRRVPAGVTPATLARTGTIAPVRPEVLPASAFHAFQTYQAGPVRSGQLAPANGYPDWDDGDPSEPPWSPASARRPAGDARFAGSAGGLPPMQNGHPGAAPAPAPPTEPRPAHDPADGRRPIEERILLPARKVR
jgi:hypothetical protein